MKRYWLDLEILAVYSLILIRIWIWQNDLLTAIAIAIALYIWKQEKYKLKRLGIKPRRFNLKHIIAIIAILWFSLKVVSVIYIFSKMSYPAIMFPPFSGAMFLKTFAGYSIWALFQQLWLNGYFAIRLKRLFQERNYYCLRTYFATGALFAIIHLPNPVLMIATFVGGTISTYFFFKTRNLYVLALAHALIAIGINYYLPYQLHHNLRIGPGY